MRQTEIDVSVIDKEAPNGLTMFSGSYYKTFYESIYSQEKYMAAITDSIPRQHNSVGKDLLLGISKRSDDQLWCLLIHCALSEMRTTKDKDGYLDC
jgi:hypothetical protein